MLPAVLILQSFILIYLLVHILDQDSGVEHGVGTVTISLSFQSILVGISSCSQCKWWGNFPLSIQISCHYTPDTGTFPKYLLYLGCRQFVIFTWQILYPQKVKVKVGCSFDWHNPSFQYYFLPQEAWRNILLQLRL